MTATLDPIVSVGMLGDYCRQRDRIIKANTRLTNQALAFLRSVIARSDDTVSDFSDPGQREALNAKARDCLDRLLKDGSTGSFVIDMATIRGVQSILAAKVPIEAHKAALEEAIEAYAKTLPLADWVVGVKGVGMRSYGLLIGALVGTQPSVDGRPPAVYPSDYKSRKHLWKRLGVAPYKGQAGSTWKRTPTKLSSDEWVEMGYNPARCALCFVLADTLIRAQVRAEKEIGPSGKKRSVKGGTTTAIGPYGGVYLAIKAREVERNKTRETPRNGMHIERIARRATVQAFLSDLYNEWKAWAATVYSQSHNTNAAPPSTPSPVWGEPMAKASAQPTPATPSATSSLATGMADEVIVHARPSGLHPRPPTSSRASGEPVASSRSHSMHKAPPAQLSLATGAREAKNSTQAKGLPPRAQSSRRPPSPTPDIPSEAD